MLNTPSAVLYWSPHRGTHTPKALCLGLVLYLALLVSACSSSEGLPTTLTSPSLGEGSQKLEFVDIPQGENPSNTLSSTTRPEPGDVDSVMTGVELPEFLPGSSIEQNLALESPSPELVAVAGCSADPYAMQLRALQLLNEARAVARNCGSDSFAAAPTLRWNALLANAATVQSGDMATNNFFSHTGSDGSSAAIRVSTAGYNWQTVGENIAGGRSTVAETIDDWLDSPGHCRNIMNASFTEVAVSCAENVGSDYRRYWTNVLAAPR